MADITLWRDLERLAGATRKKFRLKQYELQPLTLMRRGAFGYYSDNGVILLRVHQLNRPRRPLARSTILHTLAHELAHLRTWRHGRDHATFAREIWDWWKEEGWL